VSEPDYTKLSTFEARQALQYLCSLQNPDDVREVLVQFAEYMRKPRRRPRPHGENGQSHMRYDTSTGRLHPIFRGDYGY